MSEIASALTSTIAPCFRRYDISFTFLFLTAHISGVKSPFYVSKYQNITFKQRFKNDKYHKRQQHQQQQQQQQQLLLVTHKLNFIQYILHLVFHSVVNLSSSKSTYHVAVHISPPIYQQPDDVAEVLLGRIVEGAMSIFL